MSHEAKEQAASGPLMDLRLTHVSDSKTKGLFNDLMRKLHQSKDWFSAVLDILNTINKYIQYNNRINTMQ